MTRAAAVLAALLTASLAAQAARLSSQPERPLFKTGVDVTQVDVSVVDRDGNPVNDLKAADFTVTVDGKPRTIVSAQFMSYASAAGSIAAPPHRDYATNRQTMPGRLIALVVDQGNIRFGNERSVLRAAEGFLDRLTPADRVALLTFPPPGASLAFTGDMPRVKQALRTIRGGYDLKAGLHHIASTESLAIEDGDADVLRVVAERECARNDNRCPDQIVYESRAIASQVRQRASGTVRALGEIFTFLCKIDGPKTVVWIAEGLVLDATHFPQGLPPEIEHLAGRARARIYVLRPALDAADASENRPVHAVDEPVQTVGLETIAGVTGGQMLTVVGAGASVFERVARETAGDYLLGIETLEQDRDGKRHRIKVSVRRGRLQVRARRELEASAPANQPVARSADHSAGDDLLAALRAPLLSSAVPIRVSSYVLQDPDRSKVRLMLTAELGEPSGQAVRMAVGYELRDPEGNAIAAHVAPVTLHPGADGRLLYREEFSVKPGDYTYKLATADAAGHIGTIDHSVRARLTRIDAIEAADLLLNDAAEMERGTPVPVEATIVSGTLWCGLDLRTPAGAKPDGLQVSIEIVDRGGRQAMTAAAQVASDENGVRHLARARLDTSRLESGDYVAHAVLSSGGRALGEITRGFRVK